MSKICKIYRIWTIFFVPICCSESLSFQILIQRYVCFEHLGVNNNKERLNENGHQYVCYYYNRYIMYILSLTASLLTYHWHSIYQNKQLPYTKHVISNAYKPQSLARSFWGKCSFGRTLDADRWPLSTQCLTLMFDLNRRINSFFVVTTL